MARLRYLQNKRSGTHGTISKSTEKVYFYDEGLYIGATADGTLALYSDTTLNVEGATALNLTATTITLTGAITVDGDITFTGDDLISVTVTNPVVATNGIYCETNAGGSTGWTGSVAAMRGRVYITNTGTSIGNAYGGWFGVKFESTFTAAGGGLTCGVYAESANELAGRAPNAVAYFQEVISGSGNNSGMPILVLTSTGGSNSTKSGYAIEFGHAPAATTVSTGSGNMYHEGTIQCKINGTDMYMPFSTAQGTFTFAYPIVLTNYQTIVHTIVGPVASALAITTTSAETSSTVVLPLFVDATMSGDGGLGRAIEGKLTVGDKLGDYGNAIKGYTDLTGGTGCAGLVSAICAEMKMPAGTALGTHAVLEIELVMPSSAVIQQGIGANCTSFIRARVSDTAVQSFNDYGYLLDLQGLSTGSGDLFDGCTLKCAITSTKYYLLLSTETASFTTAYPISSSNATKGIAFTAATTNYISFDHVGTAGTSIALHFVDSYNGMVIETGTLGTNTGITLSVDNHRPVSFLFDDGGSALVAENYRGVLSRIYLSQDQTNQVAIRAMRGHIKIADDKDFNVGANEFGAINGVEGYIETTGTNSIVVGATSRVAAIHGYVELRQNTSITSGGILTAVFAELGMNTETITNECAGVWIDVIDSAHGWVGVWPVGLKIADSASTTGIEIGDCTTGITLDGTITTGLNIDSGATTGIAIAAASTAAIAISGANADGILFTGTYTSGACIAIGTYGGASIHLVDSRPLFYFSSLLNASEATSALRPMFQQTRIQPKVAISSVASVFSYVCRLEFLGGTSSNTTYSANMPSGAISGEIWSDGVANTEVTAGVLSALHANMGFGANSSVTGANYCGLFIYDQTNSGASIASALHSGILIDGGSGFLTMGNAIKVTNNVTNFLYITDDGALAADVAGSPLGDIQGTASTGFIRVSVGGTTRYIALYTAN